MFKGRFPKLIFRRSVIVAALILFQLLFLIVAIAKMANQFVYIYAVLACFSMIVVIYIVGVRINPAYKLAWTILILLFPIFGGIFYLLFGTSRVSSNLKKKILLQSEAMKLPESDKVIVEETKSMSPAIFSQIKYVNNFFPVYYGEESVYYKNGEEYFEGIIRELEKAEKYIFIEYFIISEGKMWETVLDIIKKKAASGIDVRIVYDDCGCLGLIPDKYGEKLEKSNIKCRVFNPLRPSLSITMNNRDHRKMLIIDGKTAFTGGINLGDEYINEIHPHGHWKDSGIMVKGECVNTFVHLFFEIWNLVKFDEPNPEKFYYPHEQPEENDGYIQPYGDQPYDEDTVGENVYLNIINKAQKELYISTPYLILDNELTTALMLAAKNGVNITIITPGIADKWYVHMITRSNYSALIEAGVNIYEYSQGFIHSKTFLCDDEIATIGSINLDYRSLYLHFECGVILYKQKVLKDIKNDFCETIPQCEKITKEKCESIRLITRIIRSIIRVFAPLM